eukprot:PhM_4_TR7286/c0_g1_i1/m.35409
MFVRDWRSNHLAKKRVTAILYLFFVFLDVFVNKLLFLTPRCGDLSLHRRVDVALGDAVAQHGMVHCGCGVHVHEVVEGRGLPQTDREQLVGLLGVGRTDVRLIAARHRQEVEDTEVLEGALRRGGGFDERHLKVVDGVALCCRFPRGGGRLAAGDTLRQRRLERRRKCACCHGGGLGDLEHLPRRLASHQQPRDDVVAVDEVVEEVPGVVGLDHVAQTVVADHGGTRRDARDLVVHDAEVLREQMHCREHSNGTAERVPAVDDLVAVGDPLQHLRQHNLAGLREEASVGTVPVADEHAAVGAVVVHMFHNIHNGAGVLNVGVGSAGVVCAGEGNDLEPTRCLEHGHKLLRRRQAKGTVVRQGAEPKCDVARRRVLVAKVRSGHTEEQLGVDVGFFVEAWDVGPDDLLVLHVQELVVFCLAQLLEAVVDGLETPLSVVGGVFDDHNALEERGSEDGRESARARVSVR